MMPKKVLVIENDRDILDIISHVLNDENFAVQSTSELPSASVLKTLAPDVILLDEFLCPHPSAAFCRTLQPNGQSKRVPIILTSTNSGLGKMAAECHADGFINKPFDLDELIQAVKEAVY